MKAIFVSIVIVFCSFASLGQTLSGSRLPIELVGEKYCIKTIEPNYSYALFSNHDLNNDSVIDVFSGYNIIPFKDGNHLHVKLFYDFAYYRHEVEIFDLNSGTIIPKTSEDSILVVYEEQVFISNNNYGGAKIIDAKGSVLSTYDTAFIEYSSVGFFNSKTDYNYEEEFFDKNGNLLSSFKKHAVLEEVIPQVFIVINDDNFLSVIDFQENILFADECCCYSMVSNKTYKNNISYITVSGLCYQDDDVSVLVEQKNGKWIDPLKKVIEKYWVRYVKPQSYDYNSHEISDYYIIADEQGMIVDEKGKVQIIFENAPEVLKYEKVDDLIFLHIDNSMRYFVYNKKGQVVIPNELVQWMDYESLFPDLAYKVFVNDEDNLAFIYHEKTNKTVSLERNKLVFKTLGELEQLFLTGDDVLKN